MDGGLVVPHDRDFRIELDGQPGSYGLHVSSSVGDERRRVKFDPACISPDLGTLEAQVLASATGDLSKMTLERDLPLRQVGHALFEAVFPSSVNALFSSSRTEAERAGRRLRIVLRLGASELAILPWELLFSEPHGGYLCRRSPVVRYVDAPEPVLPLTTPFPLRVLGMDVSAEKSADGGADPDQRRLQIATQSLQLRGLAAADWVEGQTWEAAQEALYAGCHVFHFVGYGGIDPDKGEGLITLADEQGHRHPVRAPQFADLLSLADPMPRLVILDSCQTGAGKAEYALSSTAASLVRAVQAVVAMQFPITDKAATIFFRAFYQALVHNRGVDEAVRAGRISLAGWNADSLEWLAPVLYLRSTDARLFDLTDSNSPPSAAVGAEPDTLTAQARQRAQHTTAPATPLQPAPTPDSTLNTSPGQRVGAGSDSGETRLPRRIAELLRPDEPVIAFTRMHPAILISPIAETLGGLSIAGLIATVFKVDGAVLLIVWLAWLVLLTRLVLNFYQWSRSYFTFTSKRILLIDAGISRREDSQDLDKVSDVSLETSALGRWLGYGTFTINTLEDGERVSQVLNHVPSDKFDKITATIIRDDQHAELATDSRRVIESYSRVERDPGSVRRRKQGVGALLWLLGIVAALLVTVIPGIQGVVSTYAGIFAAICALTSTPFVLLSRQASEPKDSGNSTPTDESNGQAGQPE